MTDEHNGNLQLVLSQVLAAQQSIAADIAAMRSEMGKVAVHLERVDTRNEGADRLHTDHETRLRVLEKLDIGVVNDLGKRVTELEKYRWKAVGVLSVVEVIVGFAAYVLGRMH